VNYVLAETYCNNWSGR